MHACPPRGAPGPVPAARPAAARPDHRAGPTPRLGRLRAAIVGADYQLCTQKAELLTEFLEVAVPGSLLAQAVSTGHFAIARKAMAQTFVSGAPQPAWKLALNARLEAMYHRLDGLHSAVPRVVVMAHALRWILARVPLRIYDDELIVGNCTSHRLGAALHPDYGGLIMLPELRNLHHRAVNPIQTTPDQLDRLEHHILPYWFSRSVLSQAPVFASDRTLQNTLLRGREFVLTQFAGISHVTPDHGTVLELGYLGLLDRIEALARGAGGEAVAFYSAAAESCRAVIDLGHRWHHHCARAAARCTDPTRAAELQVLADIFAQVPARPARTFHEALQSIFLTHVALHQESFQHGVSFGRLDQLLLPFYERDLAAGRIDETRAVELLGCFLGKAAEQVPLFNGLATRFFSGLSSASGITIGGTDTAGADQSNAVTHLILAAMDRMRLRQPNLHLRWGPGTAAPVMAHAAEVVGKGGGVPAFFNDLKVPDALRALGVSREHAHDYAVVGCVEWGVPGRSFPAAGAGFINLAAALLDAWAAHPECVDFEALFAAFGERLATVVAEAVDGNNAIERTHGRDRPTPLLSVVVGGCLEEGRDVTAGGATIDSTGLQGVGLADVADSLAAVRWALDAGWTMERVRAAVAAPEGSADRERLATAVPRFGEDGGPAEEQARRVLELYSRLVRQHRNPRGGPYAPGFWSMTTHVGFGEKTGALPSGRAAGAPLANGLSPRNGADARGPTAALLSVARVAGPSVSNGYALNLALAPQFVAGETGQQVLSQLVEGYFHAGGMQVQFNVLDVDELLDARAHPERHRGLVVRVSGYSAYFVDLTPQMQDEIIARMRHVREG